MEQVQSYLPQPNHITTQYFYTLLDNVLESTQSLFKLLAFSAGSAVFLETQAKAIRRLDILHNQSKARKCEEKLKDANPILL